MSEIAIKKQMLASHLIYVCEATLRTVIAEWFALVEARTESEQKLNQVAVASCS